MLLQVCFRIQRFEMEVDIGMADARTQLWLLPLRTCHLGQDTADKDQIGVHFGGSSFPSRI